MSPAWMCIKRCLTRSLPSRTVSEILLWSLESLSWNLQFDFSADRVLCKMKLVPRNTGPFTLPQSATPPFGHFWGPTCDLTWLPLGIVVLKSSIYDMTELVIIASSWRSL
uniref:Uncharacterized protein n=1 Tax=Physcomitrium patens TaxID=3218 RepID=A0A2K1J2M6_PHYPA|nr:hypothetical protein PHYPA_021629 [Physcomitrium patens]